jgi:hypothetical protein
VTAIAANIAAQKMQQQLIMCNQLAKAAQMSPTTY